LMPLSETVIPAQAGIQDTARHSKKLDSCFHGNDEEADVRIFCGILIV
jgi:hypothetical protein